MFHLPTNAAFPGCQVARRKDGTLLLNRTNLWSAIHAEQHRSKPSSYLRELTARLKVLHKIIYPHDDPSVANFHMMHCGADDVVEVGDDHLVVGEGMHVHLAMTYFWWAFSGHRLDKERTRLWSNRLAAAACFRDFVNCVLSKFPNEVYFYITWDGRQRPCRVIHGVLHMLPIGCWRELPALERLLSRWQWQSASSCGNGLHWIRGSPYNASVVDLLVGGSMLSCPRQDADLFCLLHEVLGQLGNLLMAVLPSVITKDPGVIQARPHHHFDKNLLAHWLDEVLHNNRFSSLPGLLRSLQIAGVSQLCDRIYKVMIQRC